VLCRARRAGLRAGVAELGDDNGGQNAQDNHDDQDFDQGKAIRPRLAMGGNAE